ncbi:sigma 54-interacting transcriptional regulator [bacterium]|nr:sigma 54-interacting transcriptional regulator [bacterium]
MDKELQQLRARNAELEQAVVAFKKTEAAIQESEQKYRTLFESSAEGFLLMQNELVIDCNETACRQFGCSRNEIIGRSPVDFSPPFQPSGVASATLAREKIDATLAGTAQFFVWQHQRKNGELFEAEISLKLILIDGKPIVQAINRDVTQRVLLENRLRTEKEKLQKMIDGLGFLDIGVDIITATYEIAFQNTILDEHWGSVIHEKCYQKYQSRETPCDDCPAMNAIRHNKIFRKEIKGSNGRYYEVMSAPFYNEENEVDRAIEVVIDITERRNQVEKLRKSEERFRAIFDNAPIGIMHVNKSGFPELANRAIESIIGYTGEELSKQPFQITSHPADRDISLKNFQMMFEGKLDHYQMEKRYIHKNGQLLWGNSHAALVRDKEGNPETLIGMIEDITVRKNTEKALLDALDELKILKQRLEEENEYLLEEINLTYNFGEIIGKNKKLKKLLRLIEQVAPSDSTVLILGETGTGKELIARAIHNLSRRKARPLVKVNCAALPATLIESELFGHEKGAFTGATSRKIGKFELADGGTIFLDEIGDLPFDLQAKLLRVLQENELERLGGSTSIKVDVRVLAATNTDLDQLRSNGKFRDDLFFRLNVFPLNCIPLRERKDDIPMLTRYFLDKYNKKNGREINRISEKTARALQEYDWPGNIRELENIIERAVVINSGNELHLGDWFAKSIESSQTKQLQTLDKIQIDYITHVLNQTRGRIDGKDGAARILGLKPPTMRSRMEKLGIKVERKIRDIS